MSVKTVGAPSQHSQPSRRGKRAWRKNVDIEDIEAGLETLREEEKIIGTQLHKRTDDQLFQVDLKGDENLKRSLPKYDRSQLMSTKILAQRSAIPPVLARPLASKRPRPKITREAKERLLRIGKRNVKGPFNALVDHTEFGAGSALLEPTEAVKKSGTYDVWSVNPDQGQVNIKDKGKYKDPEEFLIPLITKPNVKAPENFHPHRSIELPAVTQPHQGTSYNPPVNAHQELLLSAHEVEQRRVLEEAKFADVKERMDSARHVVAKEVYYGAAGMLVDHGELGIEDDNNGSNSQTSIVPTSKMPARKTEKQRRKAAQILAEKRALLDLRHRRRLLAAVTSAKSFRRQAMSSLRARQAALAARRAARTEQLRKRGLVGQRLGKHRVSEGQVDFQLGEELSESLRELKPQGNLFRDRFLSMQHRALVEPRALVIPKRRRTKTKEYEKHAWKRFE